MATLYNKDLNQDALRGRRVAVLGFGAQGQAQALNLHDSGVDVLVGLRDSSVRRTEAAAAGLTVMTPAKAVQLADVVVMLVPDTAQADAYREFVEPHIKKYACLVFAHGFAVHYRKIEPRADLDVVLAAPMGIGEQVREVYEKGAGVPGLLAVHQDASGHAREIAEAYAFANGFGHAGVIETSIREETETDLFAEQAVLCGGLNHLIEAAFETLVEAGYQPEVAYFCCLHEVKFIAEMIQRRGIAGMRESISPVAEYGDYTRGARIIGKAARDAMKQALDDIQTGKFVMELDKELAEGQKNIQAAREKARAHGIEKAGAKLRAAMPWLDRKPR